LALRIHPPPGEVIPRIQEAIESAIPGAQVEVSGSGGHFEIRVISEAFEGQTILAKQRMVYSAITQLMTGDDPPIHAVDRLVTLTPYQASM
jgi:acid stress-induced BolA-like protein IbaG/YrbA